jgi:hypothetical protein
MSLWFDIYWKIMSKREREKKYAKRQRAKFQRLDSLARKGEPGAKARRDILNDQLKLIGVRTNAFAPLNTKLRATLMPKANDVVRDSASVVKI